MKKILTVASVLIAMTATSQTVRVYKDTLINADTFILNNNHRSMYGPFQVTVDRISGILNGGMLYVEVFSRFDSHGVPLYKPIDSLVMVNVSIQNKFFNLNYFDRIRIITKYTHITIAKIYFLNR